MNLYGLRVRNIPRDAAKAREFFDLRATLLRSDGSQAVIRERRRLKLSPSPAMERAARQDRNRRKRARQAERR